MLYVRARDAAGNWGPFTSTLVTGADQGGPATREPQLKPNVAKATNSTPVDLSATADDSTSGNSAVTAAEYFIDNQGPDGTGTAMAVSPPGASVASLDATIPPATLDALPEGSHAIYVHAQDAQGNWGEAITVNLTVDETGPLTSGLSASPTPNNGAQAYNSSIQGVRVIATTMTDPISSGVNSPITDAEAFLDSVGANGTGIRLTPSNGTYTGTTEGGYTDIPLVHGGRPDQRQPHDLGARQGRRRQLGTVHDHDAHGRQDAADPQRPVHLAEPDARVVDGQPERQRRPTRHPRRPASSAPSGGAGPTRAPATRRR